jgi:hypothetical protein
MNNEEKLVYEYKKQLTDFIKKEKREIKQVELSKILGITKKKCGGILHLLSNYMPNLYETDNGKIGIYPYSYKES